MTFRQALAVIRRRRLLILVVIVLAVGVAAVFFTRQIPVYTSSVTVRTSSLAAAATTSGQIGTASVDFDPQSITSRPVLGPAAKKLGERASSTGTWDVTYTVASTNTTAQTSSTSILITANGPTAAQAQQRAASVATSYNTYLLGQIALARTAAEAEAAKWTSAAEAAQTLVNANPANSIAQSSLAAAIASLADANATITTIDSAGQPLRVTIAATPGQFQGTSLPIAVAAALAAGLVAGIGIALIRDTFDDRLRPDDDLMSLTGVPSLGELNLDRSARRRSDRLPAAGHARTALNEGLRALRTTLQVMLPPGNQAIVVTSVEPGDGKTFISVNLALAWARGGKRVVLIGGDLRKAGLEWYFDDLSAGPGLTELLQKAALDGTAPNTAVISESVKQTPYPGLSILPTGSEPWDPADLLAVDALGDIVASLRTMCDVIVIDSPPALALVDASLLAAHADGAVVVASLRRTRRPFLAQTVQALTTNGTNVLGVVENRSRRALPASYSAYYGRSPRSRPTSVRGSTTRRLFGRSADEGSVTVVPTTDGDTGTPARVDQSVHSDQSAHNEQSVHTEASVPDATLTHDPTLTQDATVVTPAAGGDRTTPAPPKRAPAAGTRRRPPPKRDASADEKV